MRGDDLFFLPKEKKPEQSGFCSDVVYEAAASELAKARSELQSVTAERWRK